MTTSTTSECFLPPNPEACATFRVERRYHFNDGTTESEYFTTRRRLIQSAPSEASPAALAQAQEWNPDVERITFRCVPVLEHHATPAAVAEFKAANRWLAEHNRTTITVEAPTPRPCRPRTWSISWSTPRGGFGWTHIHECDNPGDALHVWNTQARGVDVPSDATPDQIRRDS